MFRYLFENFEYVLLYNSRYNLCNFYNQVFSFY